MAGKTAAIIGATGLIGSSILEFLLADPDYEKVTAIVRRPIDRAHPKLVVAVIDFHDKDAFRQGLVGSEVVFCAIGTTQQQVKGDKEAYRKVDYDIPVNAAMLSAELTVAQYLLVSSVGADKSSKNFYLSLKGEVEDIIRSYTIPYISIFRPSMLLGQRKEFRLGERLGQALMKALAFLIPSKYKAIEAATVAAAMVQQSKQQKRGVQLFHYQEMKQAAEIYRMSL